MIGYEIGEIISIWFHDAMLAIYTGSIATVVHYDIVRPQSLLLWWLKQQESGWKMIHIVTRNAALPCNQNGIMEVLIISCPVYNTYERNA